MLSKINRLNKRKDFNVVFGQGAIKQDKFLILRMAPNRQNFSRFGFVVSAKVGKKAVKRNFLRRQLKETVRVSLEKIKKGLDVVLIAKPKIADLEKNKIKENLIDLLKKANLVK